MSINDHTVSLCSAGVSSGKLRLLDEYLLPGNTLDIGCGNGLYGLHAQTLGSEVVQVDLADRRDVRAQHLPLHIIDAQRLDLPDKCFDNVLAFDLIEHLDNDILFLEKVRLVCRKRVFLSVPNADDEQVASVYLTHMHHLDKTHRREYTKDRLIEILERTGFRILKLSPNFNTALPYFAHMLAKKNLCAKVAAWLITRQCKTLEKIGLFENRCIGDWYCVAE